MMNESLDENKKFHESFVLQTWKILKIHKKISLSLRTFCFVFVNMVQKEDARR